MEYSEVETFRHTDENGDRRSPVATKRTSLKDIAESVGVSVSTVSYALNNGPKPVEAKLKQRILDAAQLLDYRPNRMARAMKTQRSNVIVVAHSNPSDEFIQSPVVGQSLSGIVNYALERHFDVLLYTHSTNVEGDELAGYMLDGRADGAIVLVPTDNSPALAAIAERKVPGVHVAGPHGGAVPGVVIDNREGCYLVLDLLGRYGHRAIAHIRGLGGMADAEQRLENYRAWMEAKGFPIASHWIQNGSFEREGGYEAMKKILASRPRPTAVFCANDRSAFGAVEAILEAGLRIPEDISVVGFDDSLEARLSPVPLTTVAQPGYEMGVAAARTLIAMVEGTSHPRLTVFPPKLIERSSVSPPREREGDPK